MALVNHDTNYSSRERIARRVVLFRAFGFHINRAHWLQLHNDESIRGKHRRLAAGACLRPGPQERGQVPGPDAGACCHGGGEGRRLPGGHGAPQVRAGAWAGRLPSLRTHGAG